MTIIKEILFWGHVAFILTALSIGFFMSFPIVLMLVTLHRVHVIFFDGCFFTKFKQRLGLMPYNLNFLAFASIKILGKPLSERATVYLDYSLTLFPIVSVLTRHVL